MTMVVEQWRWRNLGDNTTVSLIRQRSDLTRLTILYRHIYLYIFKMEAQHHHSIDFEKLLRGQAMAALF